MDPNLSPLALLEAILTCPGCNCSFNTTARMPKLLSCGHTYCNACLYYVTQRSGGRVVCPLDGLSDFRDYEDVADSHLYKDTIEKIMVCCYGNINHPGEFFSPSGLICVCSNCKPYSPYDSYGDWVPTQGQDVGGFYGESTISLLANPTFKARVFDANPNIKERMKRFHLLSARDKMFLHFSILSIQYGREVGVYNPGPPPPKYTDENGWVELNRFHNIIPEKYCQNLGEVRKWTISQTQNQVEAVTLKPDKRVVLRGIGLCKECSDFSGGYIQSVSIMQSNETVGAAPTVLASNVPYTAQSKQVEKVVFTQGFPMSALREYTIKVKYVGKFLYFGNPARRVEPLKGPDGVLFKVSDPFFKGGEIQSGQGSLTGPIVKLYYEPTGPLKTS